MASAHNPAAIGFREWNWSPKEKAAARRAFDLALSRELDVVIRETKDRAARIAEASELWDLERWLGERRRQIACRLARGGPGGNNHVSPRESETGGLCLMGPRRRDTTRGERGGHLGTN